MKTHLATAIACIMTLVGLLTHEVSAAVPQAAPTNLTVYREGPYKVPITWTAVNDPSLTGYQVDMLPENDFLRRATVSGTSFTAAFMKTDITYAITVRAKNPDGLGPAAKIIYKVPPASVTMAIPDLSVIPASTVAQIRWGQVPNATQYLIAMHDTQEYNDTPVFTHSYTASPAFIGGLIPGRVYRMTIRAVGLDNSFMETSRIFTAIPLSPPKEQPQNLVMISTDTGGVLSWNRVVNSSFYAVDFYASVTATRPSKSLFTPATVITLTGLTQGHTYYVKVRPSNNGLYGPASDMLSWNATQVIAQAPILSSVTPGPYNAVVSWTPAPGSTRTFLAYTRLGNQIGPMNCYVKDNIYDVTKTVNHYLLLNPTLDRSVSPVPSIDTVNPTASDNQIRMTTSPYITPFLLGWHEYGLRAYGQNDQGNGPLSRTTKVVPTGWARTLVEFTAESTPIIGDGFKFVWSPVPDVPAAKQSSYIIYIQEVALATNGFNPRDPSTLQYIKQKSGAIIKGLKTNTDYYVDVTPVNDAGEGCWHEHVLTRVKTLEAPKDEPVVRFTSGNGQIALSWNPVPNAVPNGYTVSYAPQNDFLTTSPVVKINQASPLTLTGLTNGTPYKISVLPTNGAGPGKEGIVYAAPSVPMTHTWTATITARVSRAGHQAALLPSGDVIAIGGYSQPGNTTVININATDRYLRDNPIASTGNWIADAPMGFRRYGATTNTTPTGDIVVIGGHDGTKDLTSVQTYKDSTKAWTTLPSLKIGRSFHTTTILNNGDILVVGGLVDGIPVATGERFKKDLGQWIDINPMPGKDEAIGPRSHHTATRLENGTVLVIGGIERQKEPTHDDPTPTSYLDTVLIYDPSIDVWTPKADLDTPRAAHTATRLYDGKVLIVGGLSPLKVAPVNLYNPKDDQWTGGIAPLPTPRHGHQATLLQDGSVLITGGYSSPNPIATTYQLTYPALTWIQRPNMPDARTAHSATRLTTGELLIHGGQLSSSTTNTSYIYQ